jgi:hypothetical protein
MPWFFERLDLHVPESGDAYTGSTDHHWIPTTFG